MIAVIEVERALGVDQALFVDDRLEQLLLVLEIDVERALGDAGRAGDVAHAGGVEASGQEDRPRALDDLAPFGAVIGRWPRPALS